MLLLAFCVFYRVFKLVSFDLACFTLFLLVFDPKLGQNEAPGPLGAHFWSPWALFGRPWAPLSALGVLLGALGGLWSAPRGSNKLSSDFPRCPQGKKETSDRLFWGLFWSLFGSQRGGGNENVENAEFATPLKRKPCFLMRNEVNIGSKSSKNVAREERRTTR